MWLVYILELKDSTYYTGITNNLEKRLKTHKSGKGSKYVASRLPFRVIYVCHELNRSESSKREASIKKLSRKNKELLVSGDLDTENKLHFFCDQCSLVILMNKDDFSLPSKRLKRISFEIKCSICKNTLTHKIKEQV